MMFYRCGLTKSGKWAHCTALTVVADHVTMPRPLILMWKDVDGAADDENDTEGAARVA